jgi:hypothetical protein
MAVGKRMCGHLDAAVDIPGAPATRVAGQGGHTSTGGVT